MALFHSPGNPNWRQILILFGGGVLLAVGGCGLFLGNANSSNALVIVGALGFLIGLILSFIGGATALVLFIRRLFTRD